MCEVWYYYTLFWGNASRVRKTSPSNMDSKEQRKYSSTDNLALEFILLMTIVLL